MNVSVVIVTHNGMKWIDRTITSLINSSVPLNIYVVDNDSNDGTVEFIKSNYQSNEKIFLIENTVNLGFGKANNIGISKGVKDGADFFFLLNQDASIEKNTVERLINASEINHQVGVWSPIHLNGDGSKLDYTFSNYIDYQANPLIYRDALLNDLKDYYEVPFVNAAAWFLPRRTIEIVGGFDPLFYHYGEDHNYIQRLRYFDLKIAVIPQAFIFHDREERVELNTQDYSPTHFINYERWLKLKLADINDDNFEQSFSIEKKYLLRAVFKHLVLFQFKEMIWSFEMLHNIKKMFGLIEKSREANKLKGANHL